jgi:magnesium chelatase family protein
VEIISYAPVGYRGQLVSVEVDVRNGIPGTDIIGLPASEVREARERVRVALRNSGFEYPSRRVLVNLAPADVPKIGNGFDLAIAVAVVASSGQIRETGVDRLLVLGELHLDGSVGPVRGAISAVDEGLRAGIFHFLVPFTNREEAGAVGKGRIGALKHIADLRMMLSSLCSDERPGSGSVRAAHRSAVPNRCGHGDYANLRGNAVFKRALTLAVAGGHHLLVVGPPGAGKSMGISLLPTILPRLNRSEALEVTRIHSLAGEPVPGEGLLRCRPFRAPHHSSSVEGLVGGGRSVRPGEVSLAHQGVLFLDEALEFQRPALQGLREPLERGSVQINRAGSTYSYPASFQLFLAANPCPCGNLGREERECLCSVAEVDRYWRRIGGPLVDRIDIRVSVQSRDVLSLPVGDSSADMRELVRNARFRQAGRDGQSVLNNAIPVGRLFRAIRMTTRARGAYSAACTRLRLSGRASVSVARLSRTIADVAGEPCVHEDHVYEAVAHRRNGEDLPLWSAV